MTRTHRCGDLTAREIGAEVTLNGWVRRSRDHGGLIFLDLWDRSGLVQVVFDPADSQEAHRIAAECRSEYVLAVRGTVRRRPAGAENPKLPTGEVEVQATAIEVLNPAKTPPFLVQDDVRVDEPVRLQHRYLDLRRPVMQRHLELRHRVVKATRDFLDGEGFWEVETP